MIEESADLDQLIKNKNKKMIIDLEKIKELEKKYQNDKISLSALRDMVKEITNMNDNIFSKTSLTYQTLLKLEVLVDEYQDKKDKARQPLNS